MTTIPKLLNMLNTPYTPAIPSSEASTKPSKIYDPSMEEGSWWIYNQLQSTKEIANLKLDPYNSFCNSYSVGSTELNSQCNNLTEYNCNQVGCCVFTSNKKCVAGNATGSTITSIPSLDYYYYQNKCYGSKCPK